MVSIKSYLLGGGIFVAAVVTLAPLSNALKYSNEGGSPDIAGAWMGVGGAFSSFEFPTGSFRTWVSSTKGLIIEQLRYESWECTDVPGQSLIEMTHVEILVNGTAITDTKCFQLTVNEDLQTSTQIYFSCDEEPELDSFGYLSSRLNSTVVPGPNSLTCNGSAVSLDTAASVGPRYEGPGSVAEESTDLGVMFPPFESVNVNGTIPDYTGAGGDPFIQGLYYTNESPQNTFAMVVGVTGGDVYQSSVSVVPTTNGTEVSLLFHNQTGYQAEIGQVFKTSSVLRPLDTDGALGDAVASCGLVDLTDPFSVRIQRPDVADGECPAAVGDAPIWQRLLAFSPQFDIETSENNVLAQGQTLAYTDIMKLQEGAPPNTTTSAYFGMNKPNTQGWITFELDLENVNLLSGSGGFTMAHIHAGSNSTADGPVVVHLIPTLQNWPTPTSPVGDTGLSVLDPPLNIGNSPLGFQGAFSADQFVGPLEGKTIDEFVASVMQSDQNYYVNVHTTEYPAGAVRGQLMTQTITPGPSPTPTPSPTPGPTPGPSPTPTPGPLPTPTPAPAPDAAMSSNRFGTLAAGTIGTLLLAAM